MSEGMSLSVVAAAAGAFILSFAWYTIFSRQLAALSSVYATEAAHPAVIALEFVRSLIVAGVLAALAVTTEADTWTAGAALGLLAWVGFPLVILSGSVLHENSRRHSPPSTSGTGCSNSYSSLLSSRHGDSIRGVSRFGFNSSLRRASLRRMRLAVARCRISSSSGTPV